MHYKFNSPKIQKRIVHVKISLVSGYCQHVLRKDDIKKVVNYVERTTRTKFTVQPVNISSYI